VFRTSGRHGKEVEARSGEALTLDARSAMLLRRTS
jgi:hypothetical protein